MVACHGMPASIVSDCDPWFTSFFLHTLISDLDCKHSLSTAFHPKTDGLSERMHRSNRVDFMLLCFCLGKLGFAIANM